MSEATSSASFTTVEQKLATAKQKKETGDQAFKLGIVKDALRAYHEALMYLLGLDKNALQSVGMAPQPQSSTDAKDGKAKEKTEVDDLVEKIYANMAACHLKNENWKRAVEAADKALAKNENNTKALFRKGKALGEQGFFERAVKVLEDLKKKSPGESASADAEIARLKAIDDERERAHRKKMKGFLSKDKAKAGIFLDEPESIVAPAAAADAAKASS